LSNAVKFTQQGRVILRIALRRTLPERFILHFAVEDTGVGIPADMLTMIFEPFTQVDGSMTRRHGGTGLGLAIARQLVEMFDGEIWVDSELGQGSTFNFTASLARVQGQGPVASQAGAASTYAGLPEPSSQHLQILLAEDNIVNQRVIARMLEKLGWEVRVVTDGRAAVTESAENNYDLILMDVQMPDMDGLSATMAIRSRERQIGGHVPIVALTAYAMQGDRERCLMAGMDDYLSKPVHVDDLQRVIERYTHLNYME
jgi:CheY-like chemotaxis protein